MSQAVAETTCNTIETPSVLDQHFASAEPYLVRVDGRHVYADPRDKGDLGDLVLVWPKRRSPRLLRRLARCQPFDKYFFASLETGETIAVPSNRIRMIHKIIVG